MAVRYSKAILLGIISILLCVTPMSAEEATSGPDFTLPSMDSQSVTLSSYRGKQAVLLFFWTIWCPHCRKALKSLVDTDYSKLTQDGLELLVINVGERASQVSSFLKNYKPTFKILLDNDASVSESLGIVGVPTFILLDKKGNIVFNNHYFPEEYKKLTE